MHLNFMNQVHQCGCDPTLTSERVKQEIYYLHRMTGVGGYDRAEHIRKAFKSIIDTIIPGVLKLPIYYIRKEKQPNLEKMK